MSTQISKASEVKGAQISKASEVKGAASIMAHDTKTVGDMHGSAPYLPADKFDVSPLEAQERYGEVKRPVVADEAWVASIPNFSRKNTRAEKWVLVNYEKNTLTFVNTFDGFMGANQKSDATTIPLNAKKFREKTASHTRVAVADCPVACTPEEMRAEMESEIEKVTTH